MSSGAAYESYIDGKKSKGTVIINEGDRCIDLKIRLMEKLKTDRELNIALGGVFLPDHVILDDLRLDCLTYIFVVPK